MSYRRGESRFDEDEYNRFMNESLDSTPRHASQRVDGRNVPATSRPAPRYVVVLYAALHGRLAPYLGIDLLISSYSYLQSISHPQIRR